MRRVDGESGMVTAELALALPSLLLVFAVGLWALAATSLRARCQDAARAAARVLARGDPDEQAQSAARQLLPSASSVDVTRSDGLVRVVVRARLAPLPGAMAALPVSGDATAADESTTSVPP